MRIVPQSTISLYSDVPINNGEQLVFSSRNNQTAYFQSKMVRQAVNCTVVRKTGALRLDIPGNVVAQCNYLSFINPNFDNKTIYCMILDYDYVNNECVEITYAVDYWQTWMFDVSFDDMYIEREHLSQSDHDKAEINPYNPTIAEFWTGETLPISSDLEKESYTIGVDDSYDGYFIGAAAASEFNINRYNIGILAFLNVIDFEDLDVGSSGNNRPSYKFVTLLQQIIQLPLSFVSLPQETYEYLSTTYGSSVITGSTMKGSGWGALSPARSSIVRPEYICIYIDAAGSLTSEDSVDGKEYFGTLMNLLTTWSMKDAIINLYLVPSALMILTGIGYSSGSSPLQARLGKPTYSVTCKKLYRYPYSYIRILSPNGDKKELQYEFFKPLQDGGSNCYIDLLMDVIEKPTLMAAPDNYRLTGASPALTNINANIDEALLMKQFPTMPYTIDTFLAQMAAVANDSIGNMTVDTAISLAKDSTMYDSNVMGMSMADIKNAAGMSRGVAVAAGNISGKNIMGSVSSVLGLGVSSYESAVDLELGQKSYEARRDAWYDAYAALNGEQNSIYENFGKLTRPAYACNEYHMSNGDGMINFSKLSYCDLIIMRVRLNDRILSMYDKWFKNFGYNSGRCGIPRVINYMHGESNSDLVPEWITIDGNPTTYIKTTNARVTYAMLPVASYIKQMFDSGVRMIKGDIQQP